MYPDEGGDWSRVDARSVKVAAGRCDDASYQQADDDGGGLHDGRAKALTQNDCDEDAEAQTKKLGRAPRQSMRCSRTRTQALGGAAASSHPVLETTLDEVDTNEHDRRARNDGGEHAEQDSRRDKGQQDFEQGADCTGS